MVCYFDSAKHLSVFNSMKFIFSGYEDVRNQEPKRQYQKTQIDKYILQSGLHHQHNNHKHK